MDGESGLAAAKQNQPRLVLLDIAMPGLDGFELCRRLRLQDDIAIIMLTARDEVTDKVSALNLGADDYVPKPFAFDELVARVRAALRVQPTRGDQPPATRVYSRGSLPQTIDYALTQLNHFFYLGIIVAFGLAGLAVWLLVRQAMNPLERLAATAAEITATKDHSRRLTPRKHADEIGRLAQTINGMLQALEGSLPTSAAIPVPMEE